MPRVSGPVDLPGADRSGLALQRLAPAAGALPAQLGPSLLPVGVQLRPRLLRDRVHRDVDGPPRLHPARRHPVRAGSAAGRPDGRLGHRHRQDGSRRAAAVRADARPEVRHLLRLVLQLRRPVLGLLLRHEGRRPDHPGRRLRAGLPAASRGAAAGHRQAAGQDRRRVPAPSGTPPRPPTSRQRPPRSADRSCRA